ncbi:MAG: lytic transglycosylase domain-containing protein [Armatimonadota bacterium]|nr:lytic transglycosylase domain-containing protein [Armatimonadota bacterium]
MRPARWRCVLGAGLVLLVGLVPVGPAPAAAGTRPAAGAAAPTSSAAALQEGARLLHEGRLQDAEAAVTRALRARPADPRAWLWLGAIRYHQGDVQWAAQAFDYVSRRQPHNARALLWLGHALVRAGRASEAQEAFRRVLLLPADPPAHELARQALRAMRPLPQQAARGPEAAAWVTDVTAYQGFARHYNPRLGLQDARRIGEALLGYSRLFNVDPRLVVALVVVESGFQVRVRSRAGAIGLGQLMPETAQALGVDPEDPVQNLYGTIRYLRGTLDRFGWDNLHLALAAYNAGRGAVERHRGIPPYDETRWYVVNVTTLYRRLLAL